MIILNLSDFVVIKIIELKIKGVIVVVSGVSDLSVKEIFYSVV